jgi:hypothetical protein
MATFKTLGGKDINARDLISLFKYQYMNNPVSKDAKGRLSTDKAKYGTAAQTVRDKLGVLDYGADQTLDPNFDYNKYDWKDVYDTVSSWQTTGDDNQKAVASTVLPFLEQSKNDRGIYTSAELSAKLANEQTQGDIDAQTAQWTSVLNSGGANKNTVKFLEDNKNASIQMMNDQAAKLKEQLRAQAEQGRTDIEASYAGVVDDIMASVQKLQHMTADEYAARGMAFSGALNQANADIAAAGASNIAKAMAEKGAKLGKLVTDLVQYTAQIDIDTMTKQFDTVTQYGLEMAKLLDQDEQVKQQAESMLAALNAKQESLNKTAPMTEELARMGAESEYNTQKAQAAQQQFENSIKLSQLGLDQRKQDFLENESRLKYKLAYDQLDLDKQKLILDQAYKQGLLNNEEYSNATDRMKATSSGTSVNDGWTDQQARSWLSDVAKLQAVLEQNSDVSDNTDLTNAISQQGQQLVLSLKQSGEDLTPDGIRRYLQKVQTQTDEANRHMIRSTGGMTPNNPYIPNEVRNLLGVLVEENYPITRSNYEALVYNYVENKLLEQLRNGGDLTVKPTEEDIVNNPDYQKWIWYEDLITQ